MEKVTIKKYPNAQIVDVFGDINLLDKLYEKLSQTAYITGITKEYEADIYGITDTYLRINLSVRIQPQERAALVQYIEVTAAKE